MPPQPRVDTFGPDSSLPETLLNSEDADRMRRALNRQINDILSDSSRFDADNLYAGMEIEYGAVDDQYRPIDEETRNAIVDAVDNTDTEYSASTVEGQTPALQLDSLDDLEDAVRDLEAAIVDAADAQDVTVLRYGTNPYATSNGLERTDKPKYRRLGPFLDEHRHPDVHDTLGQEETIDPRDVDASGLITSTQLNVQAEGVDDAVEKANYAYMILPYATAMTGNARIFEKKDLGYQDVRMPVWEKSCDIRTDDEMVNHDAPRAGKLDAYFDDAEDYFDRLDPYFVAPAEESALAQATGEFWKDVKLKFDREQDAAIVETRPLSTQPSAKEDVAAHAYVLGRVAYAQTQDEPLLDIDQVNRNRYAAMHNSMDTKLYTPDGDLTDATDILPAEIDRAEEGLTMYGLDGSDYLDVLRDRVKQQTVPAQESADLFHEYRDEYGIDEALYAAIPALNGSDRPPVR